jgi:tetratricopeptide (TPR) repeat protein
MAFNKAKAMQDAEKLVAQRKTADAIKQYLHILDKDPTETALLNTVGDLYYREKNTAEALKCFQKLADAFTKDGFTVKAIAILKKIVKIDPSSVDPILRIAELYVLQGLSREARDQYLQAVDFFRKKKLSDRALETFKKIVALDPENRTIREKFADFAEQMGRKEDAARAYAEAAEGALRAGDGAAAEAALKKAAGLNPGGAEVQLLRARVAVSQKKFDQACKILEAEPSFKATPGGFQALVEVYLATNRADDAAKLVVEAYQEKPGDFAPLGVFAKLCLQYNKVEAAAKALGKTADSVIQKKQSGPLMDILRQLWTRNPENSTILELVLSVTDKTGDETTATEAMGALAKIYEQSEDFLKAEGLLRKMMKREPNDEQLRARLNSVLEKQGKEIAEAPAVSLAGVAVEIPGEEAPPPPAPEAVDEQASMVKEALENSDLFSRYGLIDKAVAELEKVLAAYPEQIDIHRRIFEVCQRTLPDRAKKAAGALAGIYRSSGDLANARIYERSAQGGPAAAVPEAVPTPPRPVAPPPTPTHAGVEVDLSDVFATPVQEEVPVAEPLPTVEVPLDLSPPVEVAAQPAAEGEHDLSPDLDAFAVPPAAPPEVSEAEVPAEEPAPFPGGPAVGLNFDEAKGEVEFYLSQGFVDEARSSVAALEERFPGDSRIGSLLKLIEAKAAPQAPEPSEAVVSVPVEETVLSVPIASIAETPAKEPKTSVAPPSPPPQIVPKAPPSSAAEVEPPPAAGADLLGDLAGDLAAGLDGFGESGASAKPSAPPAPQEGAPSDASSLSGLLDELGDSGPSAAQDDPETHYNLGVAFREMGLLDEAIGEFQKVVKGAQKGHYPENFLQACTLLAVSFVDKGMPQIAAKWYLRALETPDLDEESTLAVLYDLGAAYEKAGDTRSALERFSEVYSQNIDYRDVAEKIRTLQQKSH